MAGARRNCSSTTPTRRQRCSKHPSYSGIGCNRRSCRREWLPAERFGAQLLEARIRVLEPAWKMLLSNKGLLPILWELFPQHENLLPASFTPGAFDGDYVEKPLLSREGANVSIHHGG